MEVVVLAVLLCAVLLYVYARVVGECSIRRALAGAAAYVGIISVTLAFAACGDQVTNVYVEGDGRNGGQNGTTPTPAPSAAAGPVSIVTVNGFDEGEVCPAGIERANQGRKFRRGCNLAITCNPRTSSGAVIRDTALTGAAPDSFAVPSQTIVSVEDAFLGNPYNKRLVSPRDGPLGTVIAPCVVRGVPSLPGNHEFEVVP